MPNGIKDWPMRRRSGLGEYLIDTKVKLPIALKLLAVFYQKDWTSLIYPNGSRQARSRLPNKELAEHFKHIKYAQLNSDVFRAIANHVIILTIPNIWIY